MCPQHLRPTSSSALIVLCVALGGSLVLPQGFEREADRVDFRMAPLEQAKKINQQVQARSGPSETLTVMKRMAHAREGRHLILGERVSSPPNLAQQLADGSLDSVSWSRPSPRPAGACDSLQECEDETDDMCEEAGHDGVNRTTVTITVHVDGSRTCSGDCNSNGAIAFVTCN